VIWPTRREPIADVLDADRSFVGDRPERAAMNEWMEAEQRIERALQLSESQRWDEALREVDAALGIDPHNSGWHNHRGFILDQLCRYEDAAAAYSTSLQYQANQREVMMALGLDLIRASRFGEAWQTFKQVIENWPEFEPAYCYSIIVFAELGDFDRAEEYFYLAQQLGENCPHCFYHIGWAKFKQKDFERAIFAWEKALELNPDYPGAYQHLAECYRALGDLSEARRYYLQALRCDPGDTEVLKDLADMLHQAGMLDAAAEKYRLITELEPECVSAIETLGEIALAQDRLKEAAESFRSALGIDPTYPGLHAKLGEVLFRQGRLRDAKRHLSIELEGHPDDTHALMFMGNCLLEMGRPTAAGYCFRRLVNLQPEAPGPHHNLAVCYFVSGRFEQGIAHCERALELRPDYVMTMHKLALALMHTGQTDRAAAVVARAGQLEPENPAIVQLRRRLRWCRLARCFHAPLTRLRSLLAKGATRPGT
jgi:tetratricopeptide (TPR) repeat protein